MMPGTIRRARPGSAAVLVAALTLALTGCATGPTSDGTAALPSGSSTCVNRVTPDCAAYTYASPRPGTVVVTAPRSSAVNNREFFWSPTGPTGADLTVCATFATGTGLDQQGVVLRLNDLADGRVSGISVTRNVWMDAFDVFNFHVWDTRVGPNARIPAVRIDRRAHPSGGSGGLSAQPVRPDRDRVGHRAVRGLDARPTQARLGEHDPGGPGRHPPGHARVGSGRLVRRAPAAGHQHDVHRPEPGRRRPGRSAIAAATVPSASAQVSNGPGSRRRPAR